MFVKLNKFVESSACVQTVSVRILMEYIVYSCFQLQFINVIVLHAHVFKHTNPRLCFVSPISTFAYQCHTSIHITITAHDLTKINIK